MTSAGKLEPSNVFCKHAISYRMQPSAQMSLFSSYSLPSHWTNRRRRSVGVSVKEEKVCVCVCVFFIVFFPFSYIHYRFSLSSILPHSSPFTITHSLSPLTHSPSLGWCSRACQGQCGREQTGYSSFYWFQSHPPSPDLPWLKKCWLSWGLCKSEEEVVKRLWRCCEGTVKGLWRVGRMGVRVMMGWEKKRKGSIEMW